MHIGRYAPSSRPLLVALGLSLLLHGLLAFLAPSVDHTPLALATPTLKLVLIAQPGPAPRTLLRKTVSSSTSAPAPAVDPTPKVISDAAPDARADPLPAPNRAVRNETLARIEQLDDVESAFDRTLSTYRALLETALAGQHHYPRLAQVRRWQGEVQIKLRVARDGHVLDARIIASSGHDVLDQEALYTVSRTAPLPPFPGALGEPSITIIVPIRFVLAGQS